MCLACSRLLIHHNVDSSRSALILRSYFGIRFKFSSGLGSNSDGRRNGLMTSMYVQYYDVVSHVPAENLAVLLSLAAGSYQSTYHYHFM